jgi:hypothetical protein
MTPIIAPDHPDTPNPVAASPTGAAPATVRGARRRARPPRPGVDRAHLIVSRVVLGAIMLQVFFAGLGIFGVASFLPHMVFGALLILSSFSLPILALAGRLERAIALRSWLLAGLMIVQGLLIDIGRQVPVVAALHPVNALVLLLVTYGLASRRRA